MNKKEVMSMLDCNINDKSLNFVQLDVGDVTRGVIESKTTNNITDAVDLFNNSTTSNGDYSCWDYWHRDYYPQVIRESYPVYIRERAEDKGKQAFEIIKMLSDKKVIKMDKVKDFIDIMDLLIKIL